MRQALCTIHVDDLSVSQLSAALPIQPASILRHLHPSSVISSVPSAPYIAAPAALKTHPTLASSLQNYKALPKPHTADAQNQYLFTSGILNAHSLELTYDKHGASPCCSLPCRFGLCIAGLVAPCLVRRSARAPLLRSHQRAQCHRPRRFRRGERSSFGAHFRLKVGACWPPVSRRNPCTLHAPATIASSPPVSLHRIIRLLRASCCRCQSLTPPAVSGTLLQGSSCPTNVPPACHKAPIRHAPLAPFHTQHKSQPLHIHFLAIAAERAAG